MGSGSRRRYVVPREHAATWCPTGRWGPRRTRVTECRAVLTAENLYTRLLRDDSTKVQPGMCAQVVWTVDGRSFALEWEIRANAVWRFGRVFYICPKCEGLATRIYVPTAEAWAACRRCWGLTYESRKSNYRTGGFGGPMLGWWAKADTVLARERRRLASAARYAQRREILDSK